MNHKIADKFSRTSKSALDGTFVKRIKLTANMSAGCLHGFLLHQHYSNALECVTNSSTYPPGLLAPGV